MSPCVQHAEPDGHDGDRLYSGPVSAETLHCRWDGVTICTTSTGIAWRERSFCPHCLKRRLFYVTFDGPYYGDTATCTVCGDRWQDGEPAPRPFMRGWRKEAAARALHKAQHALPTKAAGRRAVRAYLRAYFAEEAADGR